MTAGFLRCALAFSSLAMVGLATAIAPAAAGGSMDVTFIERATSDTVTDTGTKGDSAGDILTFANELYDDTNKTKSGDDNGWCVRTVAGKAWECVATVNLVDGQLTVEGPFLDGKDSVWAVTGGTGKHKDARGEMQLHAHDAKGAEYVMKFHLTK